MKDRQEKQKYNAGKNQEILHYAFAVMPGLSRRTKHRLLQTFSEEEILIFSETNFKNVLTQKEWSNYCKHKRSFNIEETEKEWKVFKDRGIDFIYHKNENYPEKLKNTEDFPLALFKKGRFPGEEKAIAIVGSRIPTAYGTEMARYFARELGKAGVSVISGMAFGIDVSSHKGALEAGGTTFGVLGCGPDVVYPKENFPVYEKILKQGGIISEYKPGEKPMAYRFPERNRIISALSDGVLVVEAKAKSGSLITADCALEQGKDVYALPGRTTDVLSEGCNWLIREGAKLVTEPDHILEELFHLCEKKEKNMLTKDNLLETQEKIVYDCLSLDPKSIEQIINQTNFTVSEVISILFRLELNGYIRQVVKDYYIRQM